MIFALLNNTQVDWGYIVNKTNKAGRGRRTGIQWPRGKMLGGSSASNFMIYMRGNRRDYDIWEQQLGDPAWGWKSVIETFKKTENVRNSDVDPMFQGTAGPLHITTHINNEPFRDILLSAGSELGYKHLSSYNEEFIGYYDSLETVADGKRFSAAKAFLVPVRDRSNLHVVKYAHATKIEIDEQKHVVGVRFVVNGTEIIARQRKEVVLSAGAIGSAQLLMLSGIGKEKHLTRLNIAAKAELMVGKSLQDHLYVPLFYKMKTHTVGNRLNDQIFEYIMQNTGYLAGEGLFNLIGFFNSVNATDAYPDIQTHGMVFKMSEPDALENLLDVSDLGDVTKTAVLAANKEFDLGLIFLIILNPKSLGTIRLKSNDPFEAPIIEANYLSKYEDVQTLTNGIKFIRKFEQTQAFKDNLEFLSLVLPECDSLHGSETPAYWECYTRHLVTTTFHPVGTAKMGADTDRYAVLDSKLKLRGGIIGLRVADASAMPKLVSGNTNAASIMIGEKAAAFIHAEWHQTHEEL